MKLRMLTLIWLFSINAIAQEKSKKSNFIISIDEKIVTGSISNIKIISVFKQGEKKTVAVDYYPGNLSISKSDSLLLMNNSVDSVLLCFSYSEFCGKKTIDYKYEINVHKGWLQDYFHILYIYNTDKPKYKKIFEPLRGRHYTYEFDYPGGSTKLLRKIKQDDCN